MHKIKLMLPGPVAHGGRVELDGKELSGVTRVELYAGCNEVTTAVLYLHCSAIEAEVETEHLTLKEEPNE